MKDITHTKFLDKYKLVVKRAMEPELVQWENNGNTRDRKCKRGAVVVLLGILFFVMMFAGVWALSIQEKRRRYWFKSDCTKIGIDVTKE